MTRKLRRGIIQKGGEKVILFAVCFLIGITIKDVIHQTVSNNHNI